MREKRFTYIFLKMLDIVKMNSEESVQLNNGLASQNGVSQTIT